MRFRTLAAWTAAPLAVFALCAALAFSPRVTAWELALYDAVSACRAPLLRGVMLGLTRLGDTVGVIGLLLLLLLLPVTRRRVGLPAAVAVTLSWLCNTALKYLFARPRPAVDRLIEVSGYSFPSGHSMNNMTLYLSVLLALLPLLTRRPARLLLCTALCLLPCCIGFSRVYFGAHYLTDVLAGWSLGVLFAGLTHEFFAPSSPLRRRERRKNE